MGKLLLAHLQKASEEASEDFPIKNTFIHFGKDRHEALPRHRTAPSPQARQDVSSSTTGSGASTPTSDVKDVKEFDSLAMAAVMNMLETKDTSSPKEDGSLALAAVMNMFASGNACLDAKDTPSPQDAVQSELNTSIARWNVDSRRFLGRDTRISSTMQPMVGAGPACADIVVTIFPASVSNKRGGACFKAANGTGSIQLKCNNPVDVMLSVCIGVGSETARSQRHNFFRNPLMTFDAKWDFWDYIDRNADRSTVAVSLQLLEAEDVVDSCTIAATRVAPDLIDPAIISFSFSGKAVPEPASELPFNWEAETTGKYIEFTQGVHFGDFDEDEEGNSPGVTPRTPPQAMQAAWPPTLAQQPPPSPFFSLEGSALFSFTLRRDDMVMLGLDVNRDECNQELVVERVIPGGAAESWNRQCFAGPISNKAVVPEDRIVGINGRFDCAGMLEECRYNQLLKLFVVRGDLAHEKIPLSWCGAAAPQPSIQYVAVSMLFPIPCVKHDLVECNGGFTATSAEQFGTGAVPFGCTGGALWPGAPEYFPPASTGQDDGGDVTDDDVGW